MTYIVRWYRRQPPGQTLAEDTIVIEQYFRNRQEVVQYLFEHEKDPDFVFDICVAGSESWMNVRGAHLLPEGKCVKCGWQVGTSVPNSCPPMMYDPE